MKILLAEDEQQLSRVLKMAMEKSGYQVDAVDNGQKAVDQAKENAYDVIILDIMMPVKTGIEALKEIRSQGNQTYVMMLTAMAEEDDKVNGLDSGADDYLTKPFSLKELLARLRSLDRRTGYKAEELKYNDLLLDSDEQVLESHNSISLSREETEMLKYFILNAGKELTTNELYQHVWDPTDEDNDHEDVWINICYLRQKLESIQSKTIIDGEKGGPYTLKE